MNPLKQHPNSPVNQISKKLIDYLDKRPFENVVEYRLLNGHYDNITPDIPETKRWNYPAVTEIRLQSKFADPETNIPVEVALVKTIEQTGKYTSEVFKVMGTDRGVIKLNPSNVQHKEIYLYLELNNRNESFEYRDKSVTPLFKRADPIADAKKEKMITDKLFEALQMLDLMKLEEKRAVYLNINPTGNYNEAEEIIDAVLAKTAKNDPLYFLKIVENPLTKVRALSKQAEEKGIIRFDPQQYLYKWEKSGEVLATLERLDGKFPLDQLAEHISGHKEQAGIIKKLNTMLNAAK